MRDAQAGNFPTARNWLERAHRLAPNDPRLTLDLAALRLVMGDPAAELFEGVAQRFDAAPAWEGLITARRAAGDLAGARAALGVYLSRHCVTETAAALAESVAGPEGWCGAKADGTIVGFGQTGAGLYWILPPFRAWWALWRRLMAACRAGRAGRRRPVAPPALNLVDARGKTSPLPFTGTVLPADDDAPLATRHEFWVAPRMLRGLTPPFRICTAAGDDIFWQPDRSPPCWPPRRRCRRGGGENLSPPCPPRRTLAVVMPVYRGFATTRDCLQSVFVALPPRAKIIVIDDATPEPELASWLDGLAAQKSIV